MTIIALSVSVLVLVNTGLVVSLNADTSLSANAINRLQDKESCYQTCSKTYSLHTYPKSQHLNACQRGCRFSILNYLNLANKESPKGFKVDPQLVSDKCLNYCSDAYDSKRNSSEYYACSIGCNSTVNTGAVNTDNNNNKPDVESSDREREEELNEAISDDNNDTSNQLFISPFHLLRSMFGSLLNRGSVVVERSSMSVYLSRNSNGESKLVVVQSEPEVVVHQYPDLMQSNEYDSESVTGAEERPTTAENIRPKLDLSIWTQENSFDVQNRRQLETSWSNCFSYQSGVPRWILASILLLAIVVLAWICCATTATAPEQHIKRKIGQGSDLKYLCLYEEPVKLVIDDKLPTYDELEAQQKSTQTTTAQNQTYCETNNETKS